MTGARDSEPRQTELIGLTEDGRLVLWDVGLVRPINRLPMDGALIKSGHYVIEWRGRAITVHLGNAARRRVSVLFVCNTTPSFSLTRSEVNGLVIGEVVRSEADLKITDLLLEAIQMFAMKGRNDPSRARGYLLPGKTWPGGV